MALRRSPTRSTAPSRRCNTGSPGDPLRRGQPAPPPSGGHGRRRPPRRVGRDQSWRALERLDPADQRRRRRDHRLPRRSASTSAATFDQRRRRPAGIDYLAESGTGTAWAPVCSCGGLGPRITRTQVAALQIIGNTLLRRRRVPRRGNIPAADFLRGVRPHDRSAHATVVQRRRLQTPASTTLTADSSGTLYAGGGFSQPAGRPWALDHVGLPQRRHLARDGWRRCGRRRRALAGCRRDRTSTSAPTP